MTAPERAIAESKKQLDYPIILFDFLRQLMTNQILMLKALVVLLPEAWDVDDGRGTKEVGDASNNL